MLRYNSPLMFAPLILGIWIAISAIENMIGLWVGTDTYMHGAFVIPLAALMAYRKVLPTFEIEKSSLRLVASLAATWTILMLFGLLSMINVVQQVAVLSLIPLIVIAMCGWKACWYYRSPLILLFLSIPFGDFLIPYLQSITADMSVWLLQQTGVSVLRNGWYISIANADFRVAEACSGVNFLISTFTVSAFYALTYMEKTWKRIVFMLLGIVVPIVSNGLRVYMIIMIAEMGNVEAATGVDHLVYGWIFFVFILVILFILGHFMQDSLIEDNGQYLKSIKEVKIPSSLSTLLVILILQIPLLAFVITTPIANIKESDIKSLSKHDLLGPSFPHSDEITSFTLNGALFYEVRYSNEGVGKKLISFENRLFNPEVWSVKSTEKKVINNLLLNKIYLTDLSGRRYTLYYTYKVGSTFVDSVLQLKIQQALHKLTRKDFGGSIYMWMVEDGFDEGKVALPK